MLDSEAVEHVELVEPCIICFEEFDDEGIAALCSKDIVVSRQCACSYMMHRACWERWRNQRPTQYHGMRCLVCSSPVERRRSRGEIISEFFGTYEVQSARICKFIVFVAGFAILLIVMCSPMIRYRD